MENKDKSVNDEIEIDLSKVLNQCKQNKSKYAGVIAGCMAIAIAASFVMPDKYESTAIVKAKVSLTDSTANLPSVTGANKRDIASYMEVLQSRSVIEPIIVKTTSLGQDSAILKNKDVAAFTKKYLKFQNPKDTDLIKITATSNNPQEAQMIAQSVLENMTVTLTDVNKTGRSTYLDFLEKRKNIAELEMKEAEESLETFKQESKVFSPSEQISSLIAQLNDVDQKITNTKVNLAIRKKQLDLLGDGNAASVFNSGQYTAETEIREALVGKQLALQNMLKKYTEEHPSVIQTKKELAELQNKIKMEAQTGIASSEVRLDFLIDQKQELEQRISKLSADKIVFADLQRKVSTTKETYMLLVKNMETARIQEAMNSMDLQVIDKAYLPLDKSNLSVAIVAVIGAILGAMFALGHALWMTVKSN